MKDIQDSFIVSTPKKYLLDKVVKICLRKGYTWDEVDDKDYSLYIDHSRKRIRIIHSDFYKHKHSTYIFSAKDFINMASNNLLKRLLLKFRLRRKRALL